MFFNKENIYAKIIFTVYPFSIVISTGPIGASRFKYPIFPIMTYAMIFNVNSLYLRMKKKGDLEAVGEIVEIKGEKDR